MLKTKNKIFICFLFHFLKESEEESIESDSDDEDFNDEDDDSEAEGKEQLDLDICPSGLKQELFDIVCQLREKRLDLGKQTNAPFNLVQYLKKTNKMNENFKRRANRRGEESA